MPAEFRRDKGLVRVIALLDMMLSVILFAFYLSVAVATKILVFNVPKGPFNKVSLVVISLIMWAVAFGINYLQLSTAYRLLLATFQVTISFLLIFKYKVFLQDALGPRVAVQRCLGWLRIAALLFGFISFKIIFCYLRFPNAIWFFWVLTLIEIVFRLFGAYFVREFCDDLKHHIRITNTQCLPKPQQNSVVPEVVISNHIDAV